MWRTTYTAACACTGTSVPNDILSLPFRLGRLSLLQVLAIRLERRNDIQLFPTTRRSGLDRPAVNHQPGPVQPPERHQCARHVLVATGDDDHPVQPVASGGGLDRVGDKVSGLERVGHAECAIGDSVRDTDGAELVADETGVGDGLLDALTEGEEVLVASAGARF